MKHTKIKNAAEEYASNAHTDHWSEVRDGFEVGAKWAIEQAINMVQWHADRSSGNMSSIGEDLVTEDLLKKLKALANE
jgi:hypothetical protein